VAYVPDRARCDAALVALACDQVVMHPQATLGGEGDYVFTEDDIAQIRKTLRDTIALKKARSWSLPAAMIDPKLEVFRCTRRGGKYTEYFCEEELAKQPDAAQWEKGPAVTRPGRPLEVDGRQAVEYGLANETATSFAEFRQLYGLENDPALLEPSWVDQLVEALASPYVAVLLLMIGGAALYGELHAPGIGVGGFLAAVCFVLFFWSRFLGGTADWLEVILFLLGVGCVMLEIFVLPGFGIFGLGGGALILALRRRSER